MGGQSTDIKEFHCDKGFTLDLKKTITKIPDNSQNIFKKHTFF